MMMILYSHLSLHIAIDSQGRLMEANQIHDYVYQGDSLKDMTFYDFCHCIRRESLNHRQPINTPETCLRVLQCHILHPLHLLHDTHILVQHTVSEHGKGINEKVPCVFGTFIPQQNAGLKYSIFALSHFCPFSHSNPLIPAGKSITDIMKNYKFSDDSLDSLNNFEAIHECEDQRDAEHLQKHAAFAAQSKSLTNALHLSVMPEDIDLVLDDRNGSKSAQRDWCIQQTLLTYVQSDWLKEKTDFSENELLRLAQNVPRFHCSEINHVQLKQWKEIKVQATIMSQQRQNALNPTAQATTSVVDSTECTAHGIYHSDSIAAPLPTSTPKGTNSD